MKKSFFALLWLAICFACSKQTTAVIKETPALEEPAEPVQTQPEIDPHDATIPIDDRLKTGQLKNGIKYYLQKNNKPESRAELRLAVNAGAIQEDDDQLGLAHFVEHMGFNGTENFEKSELVDYLESVGARFGPDLNAYTSFDETVYMLQVRTDSVELFDKGMLILRDWATGVTFDDEEIDKERGVVESEWRTRLSAEQRMQKKYFPVMYHNSRYAKRLPIGDPDIIRNSSYDAVKRYYKDWYRPDLMAVIVVGDIDIAKVEAQIESLFGEIAEHPNPRPRDKYTVPMHDETLISIASDPEATFTRVNMMIKHPKVPTKTIKEFRASLIRSAYNGMLNKRLAEITQQPDPPFMFSYAGYGGDVGEIDTYSSIAISPEGRAADAFETLLIENQRVLMHGFTTTELERQKKDMMIGAEKAFKEMDKTESNRLASALVYRYLKDISIPNPAQRLEMIEEFLPGISVEEINALSKQWIKDDSKVIVVTGPEKEEIPLPTEKDLRDIMDGLPAMQIDPYVDDVLDQPLFEQELAPVAVTEEMSFDTVGIHYLELANGVGVYLKQTDFKNDEILMSGFSDGGTSLYSDEEYINASNASNIINESGVGDFSSIQLEKLLAGKNVYVYPYIGGLSEGLNGSASPDDLEVMFQLIYLYFNNPRRDPDALASFVSKQKGIFQNLMSNPQYYFSDYSSKLRYDNHPRAGFPNIEDLDRISLDEVMRIYKERFGDASDFYFSFVGNFDKDMITAYAQKYLGNLPSLERNEKWKDIGMRVKEGKIIDRFNRGQAPKTNVQMYYHGTKGYNDENRYHVKSMLDYLRIKLRESLREDKGGVYGVRVSGGISKRPVERYGITISFNSDPDKTDLLVKTAKEVLQKAMTEGPDEKDMTKVKETQRQSLDKSLKENRFWQGQISSEHNDGKDFNSITKASLENRLSKLTPGNIKSAVAEYFTDENYIEIIMEPEVQESNN